MKKILVIEDEPAIRESIVELLEAEGFDAQGAANGSAGIQQASTTPPDLILCDVQMPELDGYEVLASLRQQPITAAIPFIFLTARGTRSDLRQGMELGADDYLTKPCTASELLNAITTRLEKQALLSRQSQQQLDELRSSIALSLPHELRTPLNTILGFSETLMTEYDVLEPTEVLEIAEHLHGSAERLYRLVQNFILYSELELMLRDPQRRQTLQPGQTLSAKALIGDVATQIAQRYERSPQLRLNLQEATLGISDLKLKKVIDELVDNAFKFSELETPVQVSGEIGPQGYVLSIMDQGRGMAAEQIALMGAYMQFERKLYEQQGTGLGLAIAQRMVELHHGQLSIASIPGQGTTVQVTLPIVEAVF